MTHAESARLFKVFSDPSRLHILEYLRHRDSCACDIGNDLGIPQSTLSHHMKLLCEAGIVLSRKEGKWMYYRISTEQSRAAADLLLRITGS